MPLEKPSSFFSVQVSPGNGRAGLGKAVHPVHDGPPDEQDDPGQQRHQPRRRNARALQDAPVHPGQHRGDVLHHHQLAQQRLRRAVAVMARRLVADADHVRENGTPVPLEEQRGFQRLAPGAAGQVAQAGVGQHVGQVAPFHVGPGGIGDVAVEAGQVHRGVGVVARQFGEFGAGARVVAEQHGPVDGRLDHGRFAGDHRLQLFQGCVALPPRPGADDDREHGDGDDRHQQRGAQAERPRESARHDAP